MGTFSASACRHFDFLVSEYGFVRGGRPTILPELGNSPTSVRYEGPHLFIWVFVDKNEIGVNLFVKVHTRVLRPSGRRMFQLHEILRHVAPEALKSLPGSECAWTAPQDFDRLLSFHAKQLREHCDPLLRMDLKPLEEVCSRT
jgi:hypothetical protein